MIAFGVFIVVLIVVVVYACVRRHRNRPSTEPTEPGQKQKQKQATPSQAHHKLGSVMQGDVYASELETRDVQPGEPDAESLEL